KSKDALEIPSDYPLRLDDETGHEQNNLEIMELEDWPLLYEVFMDNQDSEALVLLGRAWWGSDLPYRYAEVVMPTKLDYLKRAADCFRTALEMRDAAAEDDPAA